MNTVKYNELTDDSYSCPNCGESYRMNNWNSCEYVFRTLCDGEDGCGCELEVELMDVEAEFANLMTDEDKTAWHDGDLTPHAAQILQELGLNGETIYFWGDNDVNIPAYRGMVKRVLR